MLNILKKILSYLLLALIILSLATIDILLQNLGTSKKVVPIEEEVEYPYVIVENFQKDSDLGKFPDDYDSLVNTLNLSLNQHQKTTLLLYGESISKTSLTNITDAYTLLIENDLPILIPHQYSILFLKTLLQEELKENPPSLEGLDEYEGYMYEQFRQGLDLVPTNTQPSIKELPLPNLYILELDEISINDAYTKSKNGDLVVRELDQVVELQKGTPLPILKDIVLNSSLNKQGTVYWKLTVIEGKTYVYPVYLSEEFVVNDNNFNDSYDVDPLVQRNGTSRVPILMYHQIDNMPEGSNFVKGLYVTPSIFEEQLAYLVKKNYKALTPQELHNILKKGGNPTQKSVMITFDDSTSSQYRNGYPLLKKYGLTGVFYVVTSRSSIRYDQLREMRKNGMVIDSHTSTHIDLVKEKSEERLYSEIVGSRYTIRNNIGGEAYSIAYPGCVIGSNGYPYVIQAGYLLGVSCGKGIDHTLSKRLSLARVHVFSNMENFKNILSGKP